MRAVESLLGIDIGSHTTRAALFELQQGGFRLQASGQSPSTWAAPYHDVNAGVWAALDQIEKVCGRVLADAHSGLVITPRLREGRGVDRLIVTSSAGTPLRVAAAGLSASGSLAAAERLAGCLWATPVSPIRLRPDGLASPVEQLLNAAPELILLAGGYDGGAELGLAQLGDAISAYFNLITEPRRPLVFFCGNRDLDHAMLRRLSRETRTFAARNLLPAPGVEDLQPALTQLARLSADVQTERLAGMEKLVSRACQPAEATPFAIRRMIRFLARQKSGRQVLHVDLGANQLTLTASDGQQTWQKVLPLGWANGISSLLEPTSLSKLRQWLPTPIPPAALHDALWNKHIRPHARPLSAEAVTLDQAIVRVLLQLGMQGLQAAYPSWQPRADTIIAAGGFFAALTEPAAALAILLDGLQPTQPATFFLDTHHVLPLLGSAAQSLPHVTIQSLASSALLNLGWVYSAAQLPARGKIHLQFQPQDQPGEQLACAAGSLLRLPLEAGQSARLRWNKPRRALPKGEPLANETLVQAGWAGAWLDLRQRPLNAPATLLKSEPSTAQPAREETAEAAAD